METAELAQIQVRVICTGCRGEGKVTEVIENAVDPKHLSHHLKHHAYPSYKDGEPQGERCDCPKKTKRIKRLCVGCGGRGWNIATIPFPQPNDLVRVRDKELLKAIFGEDDMPEDPGKVYRVDGPEDHGLEMKHGYAVQVTWDRLRRDGKIPKGQTADLWAFDLSEIRVVKK